MILAERFYRTFVGIYRVLGGSLRGFIRIFIVLWSYANAVTYCKRNKIMQLRVRWGRAPMKHGCGEFAQREQIRFGKRDI